jgi:hypothetical protein
MAAWEMFLCASFHVAEVVARPWAIPLHAEVVRSGKVQVLLLAPGVAVRPRPI